jgi:hypothetical protein
MLTPLSHADPIVTETPLSLTDPIVTDPIVMIPVEDSRARRRLLRILEAFFWDNAQAPKILPDGSSERLKPGAGDKRFRA